MSACRANECSGCEDCRKPNKTPRGWSEFSVTIKLNGLEFEVSGKAHPGYPAKGPTYDCGGEPAEGPELDFQDVLILNDDDVKYYLDLDALDEKTFAAIEEAIFEKLAED